MYNYSDKTKDWVFTASDEEAVNQGCYFDLAAAIRVRDFFRTFIKHTESTLTTRAGQPFELLDWQWNRLIAPAYGWKMPSGYRRFREVECWIPKKNGKSTLAAANALYLLCADGEVSSRVYSAAADRNQAALVYGVAAAMVRMDESLAELLKVRKSKKIIDFPNTNSYYEVISADGHRNEGYNIHGLMFDEMHTQTNRKLWAALRYGGSARAQSLRFITSTAGELDETSLWYERFTLAKKVQEGKVVDIHLLPCVYSAEQDDDWEKESTWRKCNPSYDATLNAIEFRRDYEQAKTNSASEAEFKRYRLNLATRLTTAWIRHHYWRGCDLQSLPYEKDTITYDAVDLADNTDLVAHARLNEIHDEERGDCLQVRCRFWCPTEVPDQSRVSNREKYEIWAAEDRITMQSGPAIDQDLLENDILADYRATVSPKILVVDRFNASRFIKEMQKKLKINRMKSKVEPVGYNCATMNEAVTFLQTLILTGRLVHKKEDGTLCPVLDWMFGNIKCVQDTSGNKKLDKSDRKRKIDGFAAICMSIYAMLNDDPSLKSKYSDMKPITVPM